MHHKNIYTVICRINMHNTKPSKQFPGKKKPWDRQNDRAKAALMNPWDAA